MDADVVFINVILLAVFINVILLATLDLTCHLALPFATSAFSVTGLTVGTILKTIFENQGLT